MPDTNTPEIRNTNRLLQKVIEEETKNAGLLKQQVELLTKGFDTVHKGITEQTLALGELEIIGHLADMVAIEELVSREKDNILQEEQDDQAGLDRLDGVFRDQHTEIEKKRNGQVTRLLEPLLAVWDEELKKRIAGRLSSMQEVLAEYSELTSETVHERRARLSEEVSKVRDDLKALRQQRQSLRKAVEGLQAEPQAGEELPAGVGVPLYIVGTTGAQGDQEELHVLPPSYFRDGSAESSSAQLELLSEFDDLVKSFESRARSLRHLGKSSGSRQTLSLSEVAGGTHRSALQRLFHRIYGFALSGRSVEYRVVTGGGESLSNLVEMHTRDLAKRENVEPDSSGAADQERNGGPAMQASNPASEGSEPSDSAQDERVRGDEEQPGGSPSSDTDLFNRALTLMNRGEYRAAWDLFRTLKKEGRESALVDMYLKECLRMAGKESGEDA